mmetsp:Transcript_22595/g.62838  ORF Transcript_22595/g.62838 Transcript_22595/m.62838 type:complete len:108 (+) Transcript_22595:2240-2563(+)
MEVFGTASNGGGQRSSSVSMDFLPLFFPPFFPPPTTKAGNERIAIHTIRNKFIFFKANILGQLRVDIFRKDPKSRLQRFCENGSSALRNFHAINRSFANSSSMRLPC